MKQNDFYEVNGCTEFIPVTINETYTDGVEVTVHSTTHPFRMTVKQVYQFLKPHEPQKVVVPEFMDGYFRYCKYRGMSLFEAMEYAQNKEADWLTENEEVFSKAFFDGYEVEKEKRYKVKLKANDQVLSKHNGTIAFVYSSIAVSQSYTQFSKPELEQAGFGWVFDCDDVEVQEVE